LGEAWKIAENCYKLHSCCGHTHTAIDVALELSAQATVLAMIPRHVLIETYGPGYQIVREMAPRTPYQAKFSIAYCVAVALLDGGAGLEQFSAERLLDPAIAELLARTEVSVAGDLTAKYPAAWPTRVTITLSNGETIAGASDYPRGNPENPVSTALLEDKFRSLVAPRFGAATAERAMEAVQSLETRDDVSTVFRDLAHEGHQPPR
jgi:2-methylcitrate dehydratase PrpD